jgi:hypothetical protein
LSSNKAPVKNEHYKNSSDGLVVYSGCVEPSDKAVFMKGIYAAREFYGVDMDSISWLQPQYLSTLYWNQGIFIGENGEAEFSFYTGDISGEFRIVVQGIGVTDIISSENYFTVQ